MRRSKCDNIRHSRVEAQRCLIPPRRCHEIFPGKTYAFGAWPHVGAGSDPDPLPARDPAAAGDGRAGTALAPAGRRGAGAAGRAVSVEAHPEGRRSFASRHVACRRAGRRRLAGFRHDPTHHRQPGQNAAWQHRHAGAGHAQRQPAVDIGAWARCQQTSAAVPGRWAGRQPTGDCPLRPGRPGRAFRRRQLGATGLGQVLRRRRPRHHHAGALHRGRPRPGPATAPAFWPGQGVRAGRVVGQRAGHHARPALPGAVPRLHRHRADDRLPGE